MAKSNNKNTKRKTKKINRYGRKEFIFNFVSISLIILLGFFIGFRSLYYYSKQTSKVKNEINTLAGVVLQSNKLVKEGNGFHQVEDGYMFKGNVDNNYVSFAGRLFRIIKVNEDNSVRVASDSSQGLLLYGDDFITYKESNIYNWLNKTTNPHSGVYYDSIPGVENLLTKTSWCMGELIGDEVKCGKEEGEDYFTLLTLNDYIDTLGRNSYLNTKKNNWILGSGTGNTNLYIGENGSMISTDSYESFGTIVVFTFKKDIKITSGNGTLGDPYVIDQEGFDNYYLKYVRLGNDIWRIYQEEEDVLRISLTDYLKVDGKDFTVSYDEESSIYNPLSKTNIGYLLNNDYYNSLSYKLNLVECLLYTGEVSFSNGLSYENIYEDSVSGKLGLLNSFDLNVNSELSYYFLMNTTSSVGSMAYVYKNNNTIEEVKVEDKRKVVPTACIGKNIIKGGSGRIEDPFVVE